jgi:hypothetical protein
LASSAESTLEKTEGFLTPITFNYLWTMAAAGDRVAAGSPVAIALQRTVEPIVALRAFLLAAGPRPPRPEC